ncbi:IucA/IucC family protein [Rhizobium sp. C1]|uniref:IucA/IucC family protein n=1 Tax=Rhizobium sp. C1 TaxID=1349799 RepID=UPI001E4E3223|nr:IucA/IucC family protein [Rhizobium sp. C1]MCD2179536.1 IucA/IucC family siderophore biosynthesis protein [Rhizobium sp. C1]
MQTDMAAELALRSLLNCVTREYGTLITWKDHIGGERLDIAFPKARGTISVPVIYRSMTGHHLFADQIILRDQGGERRLTPREALEVLVDRLESDDAFRAGKEDLRNRVLASRRFIEQTLAERQNDLIDLIGPKVTFIEAEQGLIAGHGVHPCPKSREGMDEDEARRYSPEFATGFALRWFAVNRRLAHAGHSAGAPSPEAWIDEVCGDELAALRSAYPRDAYLLLPVHPWQAVHMLADPAVAKLVEDGLIIDGGEAGGLWYPTSSVRTLYRPDAPFMLKLSLGIGITNSVRVNLARELLRGDDMYRFRNSPLWQDFRARYPGLGLIADPAYLGVISQGEVIDGLSVSLRENPFHGAEAQRNVTLLAALCEHLPQRGSRIGALIRDLAEKEHRPVETVAIDWFGRLLKVFARPVFGLYLRHGIAMEAHQQNMLVEIGDGYPVGTFYRDNQGFFHHHRGHEALAAALPGLGVASESVFGEEAVDERILYYAFINSMLGMVGALGREGLADEAVLLDLLRQELKALHLAEGGMSGLIAKMLAPRLLTKGNLRTRFAQMDELVGPLETQSVYLAIDNPLAVRVPEPADA